VEEDTAEYNRNVQREIDEILELEALGPVEQVNIVSICMCMGVYVYAYIHIHICIYICMKVHIYIYV